jgi:hypothetical protein
MEVKAGSENRIKFHFKMTKEAVQLNLVPIGKIHKLFVNTLQNIDFFKGKMKGLEI